MYMFFWFFKQFYYCLRRIFKSGLLLLVVFFIAFLFIFVKPCFAVDLITLKSNVPGNSNSYNVPSFETLPEEYYSKLSNGFIIHTYTYSGHSYYALILAKNSSSYFYRDTSNARIGLQGDFREFWPSWNSSTWGNGTDYTRNKTIMTETIYYGSTIYSNYNKTSVFFTYTPPFTDPFIENDTSSIENWSFDNLIINCGSVNPDSTFYLHCDYEGYTFSYDDLEQYKSVTNNKAILTIPKSLLNQSIVLRNGFNFSFGLQANHNMQVLYYELGSYVMNLTTEEEEQINQDSDKQLLSDINKTQQQTNNKLDNLNNSQQETTQAVENLENTITDTNIDNSSINLPTDNSNDITQDGLNNIFTSIYNAFCVGQAQDIIFPIPFTNKNITLHANYVRQMLINSGANWVITIIEAFWWYLISRFIISDVSKKITKIKSGNVENIENSNIKEEML